MMRLILPVSVLWKSYRHPQQLLQIISLADSSHVPAKKTHQKKENKKSKLLLDTLCFSVFLCFCKRLNNIKFYDVVLEINTL